MPMVSKFSLSLHHDKVLHQQQRMPFTKNGSRGRSWSLIETLQESKRSPTQSVQANGGANGILSAI